MIFPGLGQRFEFPSMLDSVSSVTGRHLDCKIHLPLP